MFYWPHRFSELKDAKVIRQPSLLLEQQLWIYEILVNYYPKKILLSSAWAALMLQMDRERGLHAGSLKAAFEKDLLDKEGEYLALAQMTAS